MQHSDERPSTSGRPSLLSLDQQAEADRHRILSGLENKPAATTVGAEKSRKGMVVWLTVGAVVLALGAGAGVWLVGEGEKEIVLAGTAPLPATPAPAAELASDAPTVRGTADDVSTAAILEEELAPETKPEPASGAKHESDDLSKMLESGMPAVQPNAGTVPPMVMAGGSAAPVVAAPPKAAAPAAAKPVRPVAKAPIKKVAPRPQASNVTPKPRPKPAVPVKKKAEAKPAAPVDSDVALLAALVAHSKATQPKSTGAAAKLRQCKSLSTVAEANQCRARICAGAKSEPECKSSTLATSASEG